MWHIFLLYPLMWGLSQQSELMDLLSATDQIFEEFSVKDNSQNYAEALKLMLKRSYNLENENKKNHNIFKRSLHEDILVRDEQGIYLLSNIEDVVKIPVKFPNDINILSSHNLLYITTLEANGTDPENQLANDLVIFQYSSIQGIKEMGRVPVLGGTRIAVHTFHNVTYLITSEHEAEQGNVDSFQGSAVYKMVEQNGRIYSEKIQVLNLFQPNDVKFWEHQDQLYLAVGTNMGNSSFKTGTLIYRWLGYHFDCLQVIPGKNVKSVTPFTIGTFMYLAVANFQDENGNPDIDSQIYQFSLEEMKFKSFQKIKTHGAQDFSYFKFDDPKSRDSEHFLIVANSLAKNSKGSLTPLTESVVYKFNGDYFIPFQSFKLHGATQWLPIKGSKSEFLLLAAHTYGVVGYQYDGWRFTQISMQFGQSSFGNNIKSMRAFQYLGDIFLTIADKSGYGDNVNLWKLSFSKKNDLEKQYDEIETWCNAMNSKLLEDNFDQVIESLRSLGENISDTDVSVENLKLEDSEDKMRHELEQLTKEIENLENLLKETEEKVENFKNDSELPIVIGSNEIASFDIKCNSEDCCSFKNLNVLKLNGEDFQNFLSNVVYLDEDLKDLDMEFEHVVVEDDISSTLVNGHPSETLIDLTTNTFINSNIVVNGTVTVNELNVNGLLDGIRPDKDHLLLNTGSQTISEKLFVDTLKVKNLKLSGNLNGELIENLSRKPETDLESNHDTLKINNMFVEGLVGGQNLTQLFAEALRNSGDQEIEGDVVVNSLQADEVFVDSSKVSNIPITEVVRSYKQHLCNPKQPSAEEDSYADETDMANLKPKSADNENENNEEADEYVIIVEGSLKVKDISDSNNSTSLSDIIDNSYLLNETTISSNFTFSDLVIDDFEVFSINDIPLSSWILRNSDEIQIVGGEKRFLNGIHIRDEVSADSINGINFKELEKNVLKLEGDQIIPADLKFETITCYEIEANTTNLGISSFNEMGRYNLRESTIADRLIVENLTIFGDIDSVSWDSILQDSVFNGDVVSGAKSIEGTVRVKNLNVSGTINDLLFDEFMAMTSKDASKILLDTNVTLDGPLNVEELHFEGRLDSILTPQFEHEWLLQNETQIITGPITFENVEVKSGSNLMNETINNISLRKLFTKSLKINEDTKIRHLFVLDKVGAKRIDVDGTLNGADFNESVVRSKYNSFQELSGEWFFNDGLIVNGSFVVKEDISGLNMSHICGLTTNDKVSLVVEGSVQLKQEPKVNFKTNGIDLEKTMREVWMRTENTTLKGQSLQFGDAAFQNRTILAGNLNNVNLTNLSKYYWSKSQNRVISSDFEFDQLVIEKWCRMHTATVDGTVNGVNLTHWAKNVLLQGEDQVIEERLSFEIFQTSNLELEGTVNGLNLSKDVLRFDVDDAVVEGEKTFFAVNVLNLTLPKRKKLQEVDIDAWRENLVKTTGDFNIKGDLTLINPTFQGPFTVHGKVNDVNFDSEHLLLTSGNQVVTGVKLFNYKDDPEKLMRIRFFEVLGPINGVNVSDLLKNQAYTDRNLVFTKPKTFTRGLSADSMEVDGLIQGVNISGMCSDVLNPVDVNSRKKEFYELLNQTKELKQVIKDRAFFFSYVELIQTLKPNIKAVVPTIGTDKNYMLAVFTPTLMRFMDWNEYSDSFTNADEGLQLKDNITFVTSEISKDSSLLYIENTKSAKIFQPQFLKEIESTDTSCVASFHLKPLNKSCIFIGQKWNSSRILCNSFVTNDLQTYQWLDSKGSVQVAVLNIDDEVYIAVINKEEIFNKIEHTLSIYRFDWKLQHFYVTHTLAEVNPVALSSITYKNDHYLVAAGGHLPESVHNSVLSIFKFNKRHRVFVRSQSILVDTPVDVNFAQLPSSQLALYVLTSNPTKPFVVFLYKGISGFIEETSGLSLYPGSNLYSFTDTRNQHFVVISGFGRGQILRAGFKGDRLSV